MYYRRSKTILVGSALILGLGALTLIPAEPGRISEPSFDSVTSQETVATIDAMLGVGQATAATPTESPAVSTRSADFDPPAGIRPASLATDIAEEPKIDPSLRPDAIGSKAVNLRSGPSTSTAAITVLQPGQAVHAGTVQDGWVEVTLDDGSSGWVYARYLASVAATLPAEQATSEADDPDTTQAADTTRKAVVRGGDGDLEGRVARIESRIAVLSRPDGKTLFRTEPGERVRIIDARGDWLQIRTADGTTGWIQRAG